MMNISKLIEWFNAIARMSYDEMVFVGISNLD